MKFPCFLFYTRRYGVEPFGWSETGSAYVKTQEEINGLEKLGYKFDIEKSDKRKKEIEKAKRKN